MKKILIFTLLISSILSSVFADESIIKEDLSLLENTIKSRPLYETEKRGRIDSLLHELYLTDTPYSIYKNIYEEYKSYNYDTALIYVHHMQQEAQQLNDKHLQMDAAIANAFVYLSGGLFKEAYDILSTMPQRYDELPNLYHMTFARLLWDMADYAGGEIAPVYDEQANTQIQHIIAYSAPEDSAAYWYPIAAIDLRNGNYPQSIVRMQEVLKDTKSSDHERAIYESSLAFLYLQIGDTNLALHHYIHAAIYDIRSCTYETVALRMVAEILFHKGEISLSEKYIRLAMNDAKRYHARHRQVSISQILPIIELRQTEMLHKQRWIAFSLLAIVFILLILCGVGLILISRRSIMIHDAQKTIHQMNQNLVVANKLKETMLSSLLAGNSQYLATIEQYQQRVREYAVQRRYADLMTIPKNVDARLRRINMNHQLDETLLSLYPTFVQDFNQLLRPKEQFQLKKNELLNTPMRIFALIRLGISHNDSIAEILNCSINTVYTYKTKTILRSDLSSDDFFNKLMRISSFQ